MLADNAALVADEAASDDLLAAVVAEAAAAVALVAASVAFWEAVAAEAEIDCA